MMSISSTIWKVANRNFSNPAAVYATYFVHAAQIIMVIDSNKKWLYDVFEDFFPLIPNLNSASLKQFDPQLNHCWPHSRPHDALYDIFVFILFFIIHNGEKLSEQRTQERFQFCTTNLWILNSIFSMHFLLGSQNLLHGHCRISVYHNVTQSQMCNQQ